MRAFVFTLDGFVSFLLSLVVISYVVVFLYYPYQNLALLSKGSALSSDISDVRFFLGDGLSNKLLTGANMGHKYGFDPPSQYPHKSFSFVSYRPVISVNVPSPKFSNDLPPPIVSENMINGFSVSVSEFSVAVYE